MFSLPDPRLRVRPAAAPDQPFLRDLYASTRRDELARWGWTPKAEAAFLDMQWRAQQLAYAARFGTDSDGIVLHDEAPIGRIWVHQQAAAWHLVDLAIIEQHRGRGVGRTLVCQLQTAARGAGAQITLQVRRDNRARRLYERLGFQVTGQTDLDLEMAWTP